jgi:hypothetical protein
VGGRGWGGGDGGEGMGGLEWGIEEGVGECGLVGERAE